MGNDITFVVSNADLVGFSNSRVDRENLTIRGVTMITGGLTADGHDLHVDDTTLQQLHELAVKRGKVPVTLEHTGGIKDVNGYLTNFSVQGNKLKADWHLLQYHEETPVMIERAEKQPETFGLSVAFKGKGVQVGGKKCARAEKLLSADCVKRPAAAPDGLFSAKENEKVDTGEISMDANQSNQNENQNVESNQILEALNGINQRLDAFEEVQGQLVDHINNSVTEQEGDFDEVELLEALYNATDEELDAFNEEHGTNITREQIEADVDAYNASVEAAQREGEGEGNGTQEGVGQGAGQGGEVSSALSTLAKEIIELKAKDRQKTVAAKAEAEAIEFAELQENIGALVEQRDRLVELSERVIAENEALRMAGVRGGVPAGAGAEIEFKERHQGGSIIEFEEVVNTEYARLLKEGLPDIKAQSKAIDFGVKRHPVSYKLWRERGNPTIEFSAE